MMVEIFTLPDCSDSAAAKRLMAIHGVGYAERDASNPAVMAELQRRLPREASLPQVFLDGVHLGGYDDLRLRLAN